MQYGTSNSTIEYNTIRDNTALARPPLAGVILGKSADSVLRGNTFSNNTIEGYSAILLKDDRAEGDEAAGGPVRWTITGNTVFNSGTPLTDSSKLGSGNAVQSSWQAGVARPAP